MTASSSVVNGSTASLVFTATAGAYTATKTDNIQVGVPPVVIIGTGTSSTGISEASPVNVWYKSLHGQSIYTAAELNAAGVSGLTNITQIGFNIITLPTVAMPSFIVRMKHTSSTNVATWITVDASNSVYTNASYLPTATGYNMFTLSTPFQWNGTDNIVIDTAFGVFTPTYEQTGTVQYTSVTNGYRYVRYDYSDQTNIFTGGYTSSYRPNLKLIFQPQQIDAPSISANPTSVSQTVNTGSTATAQITISNTGTAALTWSSADRDDLSRSSSVLSSSRETGRTTWLSFSLPRVL